MTDKTARLLTLLLSLAGLLTGCEAVKSANPLSPSVAGPIPGVNISQPKLLEPGAGWELDNAAQPVRLLIENASSNGQRPLTYTFEVASDVQFGSVIFSRGGVEPGEGGRTSVQMSDRLPTGRAFFWRARAEDGANTGDFSAAASFSVITPVVVDVPAPIEPIGGVKLSSNKPVFRIRNAPRSGPAGQIVDTVQVARDEAFTSMVAIYQVNEQANETRIEPNLELPYDQTFFWRVRAYDTGPSNMVGAWSGAHGFRTSSPPAAPAPAPPSPGGGGGGRPGPCSSNSPLGIVQCQRSKYPGHMSRGTTVDFARAVARDLNRNGVGGGPFGILRKGSGNNCNGYSCDIICAGSGSGQKQWDILSDWEGAQSPAWNGPDTYPHIRVDACEIQ